jgi:tetrahydromethanopterin S-methyltransferase subunit A
MLKVEPAPGYPPEDGRYVRGNDYSPVAVAVVLNTDADKIPQDLLDLVRAGVEAGAALAGTVQTENIGFEKMICNIVANPNIRYLILAGPESDGHSTGQALRALMANGVDERRRIVGTAAPHPVLYNLPLEMIERFRQQLTLIDLQFEGDPQVIAEAVACCYQEEPVAFRGHSLYDPGAFPDPPLAGALTWRVTEPWAEPESDAERQAAQRAREMIERLRARQRGRSGTGGDRGTPTTSAE